MFPCKHVFSWKEHENKHQSCSKNTSKTTSCPTEGKALMEGGAELWRYYVSRMLSGDEVTVQSLSPSKNSHRKWQDGSCLGTEHFNSSERGEALKQCFRNCRLQHRGAKVQGGPSTWEPEKVKMIWWQYNSVRLRDGHIWTAFEKSSNTFSLEE